MHKFWREGRRVCQGVADLEELQLECHRVAAESLFGAISLHGSGLSKFWVPHGQSWSITSLGGIWPPSTPQARVSQRAAAPFSRLRPRYPGPPSSFS
jgi:hypothetical protein